MKKVVVDRKTRYQHILLERDGAGVRLWLDGHIQFDTAFEVDYHELLADIPLMMARQIRTVLVMGGGDGLAARQILRYPVRKIINIELDPEMINLARRELRNLNAGSFLCPRVRVIAGNAYKWVQKLPAGAFDVVIADFPAATSSDLLKLYSKRFYGWVRKLVAPGGVFVTQVSEGDRASDWILDTLENLFGHAARVTLVAPRWKEQFVYASDSPLKVRRTPRGAAKKAMEAAGKLFSGSDVTVHVRYRQGGIS